MGKGRGEAYGGNRCGSPPRKLPGMAVLIGRVPIATAVPADPQSRAGYLWSREQQPHRSIAGVAAVVAVSLQPLVTGTVEATSPGCVALPG